LRDFNDGHVYERDHIHNYFFVISFSASNSMDPADPAPASASSSADTTPATMEGNAQADSGSSALATAKKPVVVLVIGMAGSVSATVSSNFQAHAALCPLSLVSMPTQLGHSVLTEASSRPTLTSRAKQPSCRGSTHTSIQKIPLHTSSTLTRQ
jgi:hypothetical protein